MQILRNACTEIVSADDCDSCCLASINLANITTPQELSDITELGVIYLLFATEYTHCPIDDVRVVKEKNRRLGLGIMGLGEWFLLRNLPYGIPENNDILNIWMSIYEDSSDYAADMWASEFNIARPIAVRAIAPTGTISIVGGHTTPGIEPLFQQAYIRTSNGHKGEVFNNGVKREVVIEPIIGKLLEKGINVEEIDTAYSLSLSSKGIERRVALQAYLQRYVDNGISSTVNLPKYKEGIEDDIKPILLKYLPHLRGITFYPDGARDNQPVVPVDLKWALKNQGVLDEHDTCKGGVCNV
jgi:ribonucleoside-diphosphate reductase alpha chain